MRKRLLILVVPLIIFGCRKNDSADLSKENNLNKQKELIQSLGFDLNKVTIRTDTTGNKSNRLEFHSVEEGKNYFKELTKPHIANFIDTLNLLANSKKEFNNYFQSLIKIANANKAKNNNSPKMSTTGIDYSQSGGFTDEEVDNLGDLFDNSELETPYRDYDPTVDQARFLNDYNNNVFGSHKGRARMKKWIMYTCYHLDFDWDYGVNAPLGSNIDIYTTGVTVCQTIKSRASGGDFWAYPGSALIYFDTYADMDLNLFVDDIGTIFTLGLEFNGYYNTNTGRYYISY